MTILLTKYNISKINVVVTKHLSTYTKKKKKKQPPKLWQYYKQSTILPK